MGFISVEYKCDGCKKVFKGKYEPAWVSMKGFKRKRTYCEVCSEKLDDNKLLEEAKRRLKKIQKKKQ